MTEFFNQVAGAIQVAFQFLENIVVGLAQSVIVVAQALTLPPELIVYVPPIIGSSITITIAIYVLKFLIGR